MDTGFLQALQVQSVACASLGSPFMVRMMQAIAAVWPDRGPLADIMRDWPGEIGPSGASLPLRLAAGLHALVLTGQAPRLMQYFPPNSANEGLDDVLAEVLTEQEAFLCTWITNTPQTNEVGRSVVLLAAAAGLSHRFGLPFVLSELGASAGLNLSFDRYCLHTPTARIGTANSPVQLQPDWQGMAISDAPIRVLARRGVDLNPLDHRRDADRLMSYIWPDQPQRLARLRAALAIAEAGVVDAGDAADWLEARLSRVQAGAVHLVFHTVAHQYFPKASKDRIAQAMAAAGARATVDTPLAWLGMEADGQGKGAGITLKVWPDGGSVMLGRVDFHGQWVRWML
jgi:hypothetical protein